MRVRVGVLGFNGTRQSGGRVRRARLLATTAFVILSVVTSARAQSTPAGQVQAQAATALPFNIPSQPLASAIRAFGRQSGMQITLSSAPTGSVNTSAVVGRLTPADALDRMLSGTGISAHISGDGGAAMIGSAEIVNAIPQEDGVTQLAPIVIKGGRRASSGSGYRGTPDWVYEEPASVSVISREAIQSSPARNARDLLDTAAGVYANRSEGQNPGVTVNIRGLQDQNRVVTMIDGARQNFQRNGHGSTQRTYVETAFIREIDVEKSGTSGVGGAGALGGSVNFRTVEADDLIEDGRQWGGEANATVGTNEFQFDGASMAAVRLSDSFSVLGGISHKKIGAYDIGENGDIKLYDSSVHDGAAIFTGQDSYSYLLKAEAELTDDLDTSLTWLRNDSDFSQGSYNNDGDLDEDTQQVLNDTLTSSLHWDPDSELIDLNARLWYNHTRNREKRYGSAINDDGFPVNYALGTLGFSIDNTSRFDTSAGSLSLNYGVEAFFDRGKTETLEDYFLNGVDMTATYTGTTPSGDRDVYSAFANATFEHDDWLMAQAGLRYDYYNLSGDASLYGLEVKTIDNRRCRLYFPNGVTCRIWTGTIDRVTVYPENVIPVDNSDGALLPSAMLAVKPVDWLQPFAKYSRSFRPPTIMETFLTGGHPGVNLVENAPNPDLVAEEGNTFELGVNTTTDGLLSADDSVRLKAVGFYREIENYIALGTVHRAETGRDYASYVNVDGTTRMKGIELEASYDAGKWYAGLSYTYLKTDFGTSYNYDGTSYEIEPSIIFVPPRNKFTIDAGMRLFDDKLTIGGRATHVGGTSPNIGVLASNYVTEDYSLYDIYGSYAFNDTVKLRFAVNNVTDVAYVPALGTISLPGPGRTATASLNFKF
jgi:hemoglobin/transferrin/lactoferrin receptor protein